MTDFEQSVLADLAELKANMRLLIGNGQPGRIANIEARVDQHEQFVQRSRGIAALLGTLLVLIHLTIDFFRK